MTIAFAQPILAAAGADIIIKLVLGVIVLLFAVAKQLFEANRQAALRAKSPVPPPPQPQPPPKGAAPAAGQQADPLRAQVEEFLRRAGRLSEQGQQQPQKSPQQARAGQSPVIDPARAAEPRTMGQPLRQAEWRKTPSTPSTPPAPPQPARPAPQSIKLSDKTRTPRTAKPARRQSVAEHVAEQVTAHTQSLANQASQLGQRIAAEDQQFDVQLKAKFDHTVGTLAGSAAPSAAEQTSPTGNTPAAQLAALLANPTSIRQAVLINEILRRPSDRW